ncbi:hypothetical protein LXA43DRAFT_1030657 [Ganoderma leucocontextum]|nr:hypothetical protein LXA43DRAFT_1030657 [Ganoderma leucocontextum]
MPGHLYLPPEVWTLIIRSLHPNDRSTCLSVSQSLHDISLPLVFSHIIVRFGICRTTTDLNEERTEEEKVEADEATRVSLGLLQSIIQSPDLGRVVTKVTVRAYTPEGDSYSDELMAALVGALNVLRLRAFSWFGCGPTPQGEVICALAEAPSASLSELLLPPDLPELCPWLPLINKLQSLSFVSRYYDHIPDVYQGSNNFKRIVQTVEVNAKSLRRLSLSGEIFTACSTWSLSSPLFEDCTQLRSLALCLDHDIGDDFTEIFEEHAHALPHLTSFRLLATWMGPEDIDALAAFLQGKTSLERLDFVNQTAAGSELNNEPLLRILAGLPRLAVFGCDVRTRQLTADHFAHLSACIPHRVTALALNVAVSEWAGTEEDWAQFFEARHACRYLHIIPDSKHVAFADLQGIAARHPPEKLELLGYKNALRWMARGDADAASDAGVSLWPPSRVYFRTVEDFDGHEEWEWLLRHHGQDAPLPTQTYSGFGAEG